MRVFIVCGILSAVLACAEDPISFNQQIRPLLSDRCFHCHGPDEADRKGKLRLDIAEGKFGAYRTHKDSTAIKPGSPTESEVWQRIVMADHEDVMPPLDSHKKQLTKEQKQLITRWIEEGAKYESFWAFVPPSAPAVPKGDDWSAHPVDRFVMKKLAKAKVKPSAEADKRTLIRRVTFDITGLPPTRAEIAEFLADSSPDAYAKLVDRLLGKPQYGEHMAKYWLDLVRFADTNGRHHDHYRDMTPYRDWVIRSFNDNLPHSEFVKYQIAGDLYDKPTQDQLVGSGFNRLHLIIDRGTAPPAESYTRNVVDRVTAVGTAFMGLTVQCAVCHDHKYDPVTRRDFYSLFAFFNNFAGGPETGGRGGFDFTHGLQKPYIFVSTPEQDKQLKALDAQIAAAPKADRKALEAKRDKLKAEIPKAMVMEEAKTMKKAFILKGGEYDKPGEQVGRDTPTFLPPLKKRGDVASRMDLADWLVADSPLTARVAVNRFWQQLFGVGIVKTAEDFGAQGEVPSHPDLLNHLTVRFVESGWDVKGLMTYMVMSKTYRQTSAAPTERFEVDAENRMLARGSRFRMDSEMIRDQILASSGLLAPKLYGKSVKPPQPAGLWKAVAMPYSYPKVFKADAGEAIYRRSVYTFWKRGMPPPQMTILNAPDREACIARRERTNTPLQALLLMNETEYVKAARKLAEATLAKTGLNDAQRVSEIYETITSKVPDKTELATLQALVDSVHKDYVQHPDQAAKLCQGAAAGDPPSRARLAAWTMLANTLYNLDVVKTRE